MRRLFAIVLTVVLYAVMTSEAMAQKYGVTGGATFTSLQNIENSSKTGWSAGATVQFKLPLGFSIQPSLLYDNKTVQTGAAGLSVDYLELPVGVQWGPDLLVFRPFLEISPFVGYALDSNVSDDVLLTADQWKTTNLNRFSYGLGLGGGIEVWRFQVLCRYSWNFGPLFNNHGTVEAAHMKHTFGNTNFGGVTLSLAFLFGD